MKIEYENLLKPEPENLLKPESIDGMPREVAIAMLTEPKAKMTAAMRRTCQRARDIVFSSVVPTRVNSTGKYYASELRTNHAQNLCLKRAGYTHAQLHRWLKRSIARRRNVQIRFVKLQGALAKLDEAPQTPLIKKQKAFLLKYLAACEQQATRLDEIRDGIESELQRRAEFQETCSRLGILPHIDPQVRRRNAFQATVAGV